MTDQPHSTESRRPRRHPVDAPTAEGPGDAVEAALPLSGSGAAGARPAAEPVELAAGETLELRRGGISEVSGGNVDVRQGGVGRLEAEEVFVQWGGVGAARADRLGVELGGVGAALTGELEVSQGFAGTVVARQATLEQSFVRTLIAQEVTATRPTGVLVLIAQRVSGDIRPVLDWRGALAFGVAFGLVAGVLRRLPARVGRRRPGRR